MSCHYSCATCSSGFYYDLCSSCPATRSLVASTCPCSSGYYQFQQNQCTSSSSASQLDTSLININFYAVYVAIGIHYLIIIMTINRVLSVRLKKIVDTCQIIGLIYYYRYLQNEVSSRALKVFDTFNFNYLTNLVCTQSGPQYNCSNFQNLFGVAFSFILFFLIFLASYSIAFCLYKFLAKDQTEDQNGKDNNLSFLTYWKSLSSSAILLYLDQTVIQTTMSISRIAIINVYGLIVGIPFLIMIVLITRAHFTTINHPRQTTLAYRAKHNYFYLYDEFYHLTYIDHIFEEQNLHQNKETLKKPFYPQSNLFIIQILFKILLATSTVVFYQYEPYLFVYCCIFLLVVYCCIMKVFFTYQLLDLWFYYFLVALLVISNIFFSSYVFPYFIAFTAIGLQLLALIFIVLTVYLWRKEKEGEMFIKTFQLEKESSRRIANLQQSENELINHKNQDGKISNMGQQNIDYSLTESPRDRQVSIRNISQKNSIPDNVSLSQRKNSISNHNEPYKPVRQIARKTFNYQNLSNRLTVRNKNSNQMLETIKEPTKAERSQKGQSVNQRTENIFTQQIESLQGPR